jgi:PAS domain S-box-containing protein
MSVDYTEIIDFLPDATFVIDSRGVVVAWNRAIEKMTSVPATEIVGKGDFVYAVPFYGKKRPILIDLVENRNPQLRKHYDFKVIDKNTLHAEAFVASAYGGKGAYLSGLAAPLYDDDGKYVGAVESIRDISDQKQVEETLRQRTNMLEETNTALKVLLRESAEAKEELEKKVLANVKELILPFINELESTLIGPQGKSRSPILSARENPIKRWPISLKFRSALLISIAATSVKNLISKEKKLTFVPSCSHT